MSPVEYVVRYFVVWLSPHHGLPTDTTVVKGAAKRFWYWDAREKCWSLGGREYGTPFATRKLAEDAAFIAATTYCEYGSPVGSVRTSRQMIPAKALKSWGTNEQG